MTPGVTEDIHEQVGASVDNGRSLVETGRGRDLAKGTLRNILADIDMTLNELQRLL